MYLSIFITVIQIDVSLLYKIPPKELSESEKAKIETRWDISFGHQKATRNHWTMYYQLKVLKHPIAISLTTYSILLFRQIKLFSHMIFHFFFN